MELGDFLIGIGRSVSYYPELRKITGTANASIMLLNIIYWCDKGKRGQGWFYKSAQEIEEETGLTYREQQSARKALVSKGFIEENYERLSHRMYFRPIMKNMNEAWNLYRSRNDILSDGETTDCNVDEHTDCRFDIKNNNYTSVTTHTVVDESLSVKKKRIMDEWNNVMSNSPIPNIYSIEGKRLEKLSARLKEHKNFEDMFSVVINHISKDRFYTGGGDKGWVADFNYILQPNKLVSLYERAMAAKKSGPSSNKPYSASKDSELSPEMKKAMADLRAEREQIRRS